MFLLALAVSSILAAAPAPVGQAKLAVSKSVPAKTVTTPAKLPPFDARSPHYVITLLKSLDAKVTMTGNSDGQVFIEAKSTEGNFGAQFIDCNTDVKACHAVAFFAVYEKTSVNLVQINDFNRAQFACRGFLTAEGQPSVMYSTLLNFRMTRDEFKQHLSVWHGCMKGFETFNRDPVAFLSSPH